MPGWDLTAPNGCRWCHVPKQMHCGRYAEPVGWHRFEEPTDEQRKARMLDRRAKRAEREES